MIGHPLPTEGLPEAADAGSCASGYPWRTGGPVGAGDGPAATSRGVRADAATLPTLLPLPPQGLECVCCVPGRTGERGGVGAAVPSLLSSHDRGHIGDRGREWALSGPHPTGHLGATPVPASPPCLIHLAGCKTHWFHPCSRSMELYHGCGSKLARISSDAENMRRST